MTGRTPRPLGPSRRLSATTVASLILLPGSSRACDASAPAYGTMQVTPVPASVTLGVSIESEGEFEGDSDPDMAINTTLFLTTVEPRAPDDCVELTVVV